MAYEVADMMTVAIARRLKNNETVFHGVASPLVMVAILLAKTLHAKELIYLNITGGINAFPEKLAKSTDGPEMMEKSEGYFNLTDIFDLSARGQLDVVFLSGVQIDKKGRINASVIGDYNKPKVRLPGGAGSAVLIPTVKKAFIWRTKHDKKTFVKECDFVTTEGNVDKIFTPLCIFGKDGDGLYLDAVLPHTNIEEIQNSTDFEIRSQDCKNEAEPTEEEMSFLNEIDSSGIRFIEF